MNRSQRQNMGSEEVRFIEAEDKEAEDLLPLNPLTPTSAEVF